MIVGFPLQASVECPHCHQPVHLPGVVEATRCDHCQRGLELSADRWAGWFGPAEFGEALGLAEGEGRTVQSLGEGAKYAYGRRQPRCQSCKTDIDVSRLGAYAASGGLRCACGEWIAVREATPTARQMLGAARFLVNEGPLDGARDRAPAEPVLFQCLACGGGLRVDGKERTVTCSYCKGSNYLPDALWLRLNPVRTVQTFFLVAELDAVAEQGLRASTEEGAAALGADPTASPEVLERLARSEDWEVRAAVARNPSTPEAALVRLAGDSDSDVLEALARHARIPPAVFPALLHHDDHSVRQALAQNPSVTMAQLMERLRRGEDDDDVLAAVIARDDVSAEALDLLSRHDDYEVRAEVAKSPRAPDAVLVALASDHDNDVRRALLSRRALPVAAIERLVACDDESVSESARKRPEYLPVVAAGRRRTLVLVGCAGALLAGLILVGGLAALVLSMTRGLGRVF